MGQDFGWITLEEAKQAVILDRLQKFENNKSKTAESLDISRDTLAKALASFEKKDAETQARIRANQAILDKKGSQDKDAWSHDPVTGFSVPVAPPPIPPVKLFQRPAEPDILTEAATKVNDSIRAGAKLFRNHVAPGLDPTKAPVEKTEGEKEKERFSKLDLTPLSQKKGLDHRGQNTPAKPPSNGKHPTPKPTGTKGKKKKKVRAA